MRRRLINIGRLLSFDKQNKVMKMNMNRPLIVVMMLLMLVSCGKKEQLQTTTREVYVDDKGIMRWNDTDEEAIFWGVNYTTPFAYAYRELQRRGVDHKEAIRRDVYHIWRLGFNAFRLHIWDVEISDSVGNLLSNEHLDLLDYLVAEVEKRGISTVLTLQTNFGNGYPERNINTGAYSYLYEKCNVHDNPKAQEAQRNYVGQFMRHVNKYTGKSYGSDSNIVGFEINNEPCHGETPQHTQTYINSMVEAMKSAGCERPIFYNASHNMEHVGAYFASDIDGATYQWYPTGLVADKQRKGNFLPVVDRYAIPFDTVKGFADKAKIIYEFDPADITYAHVYPAIARTFRTAGFNWVTQFAYDPIDIAECNTEYQTHYMNLAHTPSKAISLMIAGEVMRNVERGERFGAYPQDTLFSHCVVSYKRDLSVWNSGDKYINSNPSDVEPKDNTRLEQVVGVGTSPVVQYGGRGAYFLDKLERGVWRLEVMPDAVAVADAYEKPSPDRRVVETLWNKWHMTIELPDLGEGYSVESLGGGQMSKAVGKTIDVTPGVYLLRRADVETQMSWNKNTKWGRGLLGEYVEPKHHKPELRVVHTPTPQVPWQTDVKVTCDVVGDVDSVVVTPSWVSFWSGRNPRLTMQRTLGYNHEVTLPARWARGGTMSYYITTYQRGEAMTFPSRVAVEPLDWNARVGSPYITKMLNTNEPLRLINNAAEDDNIEVYSLPHRRGITTQTIRNMPVSSDVKRFTFNAGGQTYRYFIRRYVGDDLKAVKSLLRQAQEMVIYCGQIAGLKELNITLITDMGIGYVARVKADNQTRRLVIPLNDFKQEEVALLPIAYPVFSSQYFSTPHNIPFDPTAIEYVEISTSETNAEVMLELVGVELR
jgi:hypothetical protein